jgi:hypothetical protein
MVILGLLLLGLAAIAVIGALFAIDGPQVEYFGYDMSPVTLFFVGAATVGLGMMLIGSGTRRSIRHRRERKKLNELSEKLDRADEDRRRDGDPAGP